MTDPRYPVAQDESLLPLFRAIARTSQLTERVLTTFVESHGLTPSQFDVLATLGDTDGLAFRVLSEQSLVTGGTLTPVLNRLETKGLVQRCKDESDNRKVVVKLTPDGQSLYERTFLPFVDHVRARFQGLTPQEQEELVTLLEKAMRALDPSR